MKKIGVVCVFIFLSFALFADASSVMLESWNKLSEDEKWFCLLSEPLIETNQLSITTLNPEKFIPAGKRSISQQLLEDSWDLYSREDVLAIANDYRFKQIGPAVRFNELREKLNQTTQKSVQAAIEEIAIKNCLESYVIARLYFVAEKQDILGEYGLLAWDYGRILSVLRRSIAAGWLSEVEALEVAKPFIDELLNAYDSWEDYAVHYSLGSVFYAISEGIYYNDSLNLVLDSVKKYDIAVSEDEKDKVFTFHGIKFPGKNRNNNRILTYNDAVYKPSKEAASWILVAKVEKKPNDATKTETTAVNSFLKKKKNIPAAAYRLALLQTNGKNFVLKTASKAFEEALPAFENVENPSDLYFVFYIRYAFIAYASNDIKKMDSVIPKFNKGTFEVADLQYIYCIYYTEKAKTASYNKKYEDAVEYAKSALFCLRQGNSLQYLGLFDKEILRDSEKKLNNMIEKYRHELRQTEQKRDV